MHEKPQRNREYAMPIINRIAEFHAEMTAWRQDFHAHPELGFEETRTSALVAERLRAFGCDDHPTMGLGAGKYLAETRNFDGTVYVIFRPAEENLAGGEAMVKEGLFERFPMERVFGMHNWPQAPAGSFFWR